MQLTSRQIIDAAKTEGGGSVEAPRIMMVDGKPRIGVGSGNYRGGTMFMDTDGHIWHYGKTSTGQHNSVIIGFCQEYVQVKLHKVALDYSRPIKEFGHISGASCFVLYEDGELITWGQNNFGQLGIGEATGYSTCLPAKVDGVWDKVVVPNVFSYYANGGCMYLRDKATGEWWYCGYNNTKYTHTIGVVAPAAVLTPVQIPQPDGEVIRDLHVSSGYDANIFAVTESGNVYAAGRNLYGSLGIDSTVLSIAAWTPVVGLPLPLSQGQLETYQIIAANGFTSSEDRANGTMTVFIIDGEVYNCGDGGYGVLGRGDVVNQQVFGKVTLPAKVVKYVSSGGGYSAQYALLETGELYRWGHNESGALADGTYTYNPTPAMLVGDVEDVWMSKAHGTYSYLTTVMYRTKDGKYFTAGQAGSGSHCPLDPTKKDTKFNVPVETRWEYLEKTFVDFLWFSEWRNHTTRTCFGITSDGRMYACGSSLVMLSDLSPFSYGATNIELWYPHPFF